MEPGPAVRLQTPSKRTVKVLNPVMRRLLTSPLAGRMPPAMAVLEFTGRRSGRPFSIPVGAHEVGDGTVVFSEAPWRHNFTGGRSLTLRRGNDRRSGRGVYVHDPDAVADALVQAFEQAGARNLAMRVEPGHEVTREDLLRLNRTMVRVSLDG